MPKPAKPYDPLTFIPSPEAIRSRLLETRELASRLETLLELSERLRLPITTADRISPQVIRKEDGNAR